MAWADVASQLVTMGESVTPLVTEMGLPSSFKYITVADEDAPPRPRNFYFEAVSGSRKGPMIQTRRSYADVALSIYYEEAFDWGKLNRAIVGDWEAFRDVFTDPTQWNRPTSTIESLALDGGESIFEYDITRSDNGTVLSIFFPLEYTG